MKTVIEMAREADIDEWWDSGSECRETFDAYLERLVELARADEREACSMLAWSAVLSMTDSDTADKVLAAIRARSNT